MSKKEIKQEVGTAFLAISATSLLMNAYKIYKEYLSKAARQCNTMTGRDKSLCMTKYRLDATKAQMEKLRKDMSKCKEAKYPEKCEDKLKEKIKDLQAKHKKLFRRYRSIYNIAKQGEKER